MTRTDLFDFKLQDEKIALRPANPRDSARMLVVYPDGERTDSHIRDLPKFLEKGDVCVINDTRVIAARLFGTRSARGEGAGAKIELTLHKRLDSSRFLAFARPAKRLRPGDSLQLGRNLEATIMGRGDGGEIELVFSLAGDALDVAIAEQGEIPLPPYIASKRAADERDRSDYQTIFARRGQSVAAPTAGLHFTPELFRALEERGVELRALTLEVGAGTFLPVSAADTSDHKMHAERAMLPAHTALALNNARAAGKKILAVGTTSFRTLESAVDEKGHFREFDGETDIFVTPGYALRGADVLLTNFHLPRSTLFMLVCAFMGTDTMKDAYEHAIRAAYRFYSYGDACLLFRGQT